MKKVKKIAKRLRARAEELRQKTAAPQNGDQVSSDRARVAADVIRAGLAADVLQEVADQLAPRPKKTLKELAKARKARKAAKKAAKAVAPPTNNGATHETTAARAGVAVGG